MSNVIRIHGPARTRIRIVRCAPPREELPPRSPEASAAGTGDDQFRSAEEHAFEKVTVAAEEGRLDARLREAYERGRADGKAEESATRAEQDLILRREQEERTASLLDGIARQFRQFTTTVEQDAYRFALAVAQRIVKREVTLDEETTGRQVREAIRRIVGVEVVTLRVHPADEMLLRAHRAGLLSASDSLREIIIEADDTIERGGCILESSSGNVDARIGTQLRQIENTLFAQQLPVQERVA